MPKSIHQQLVDCGLLLISIRTPIECLHTFNGAHNPHASLKECEAALARVTELRNSLYKLHAHYEAQAKKKAS